LLPSKALFSVGSDEQFQPSVFLEDCYFHSLSSNTIGDVNQLEVFRANHIHLFKCHFRGHGHFERSNITFIRANNFTLANITQCRFSNASIASIEGIVMLTGNIENSTIRVIGNSFLNITSHHYTETGVLSIRTRAQTTVDVLDNTFLSCFTFNSIVGSLFIRDNANHSIFYIEKNSFKNGFGAATGGIFLDSNYSQ
ncbi:MAG: hypothetical protein EZS28_054157, partial [Streblomastix strix]